MTSVIRPFSRLERPGYAPMAHAGFGIVPKWASRHYRLGRSGTTAL